MSTLKGGNMKKAKLRIFHNSAERYYWVGYWIPFKIGSSKGFWNEIKRSKYKKVLERFIS
jgi:hypothetical protein